MSPAPRIGAAPAPEPAYDDEPAYDGMPAAAPGTDGALALARRRPSSGPPGADPDERGLRRLGQALAEVLAGRRPPESVSDRLTSRAYRDLVQAGQMIWSDRRPFAGRMHVKEPRDGALEMCVLVHCGDRDRVLALRLERRGVQWLCTDFETA
ncbi:Rv3235 family protein [Nonomuraea phyllanthi]|uniref:Rv3235 family protein n=1 Tax=Nonomuraea phyllanthi TaxID=2219224 RepID=UPI001D006460|nr:Rv3235 family protein [Nonomuraea phyllanthi]